MTNKILRRTSKSIDLYPAPWWWYKALTMGERNHSDMIPYVIGFLIALVLINVLFRWGVGGYIEAIEKATGLKFK